MSTRQHPTIEYVRQCFRYENGRLYWLVRPPEHFRSIQALNMWNARFAGKESGFRTVKARGERWEVGINGSKYLRSRVVWFLHYGTWHPLIDHKNRNSLDDRVENLRVASGGQNNANSKLRNDSTSGVKGVSWHKRIRKWAAKITINKKQISLGYFDDIDAATKARNAAAVIHHGEFACSGE